MIGQRIYSSFAFLTAVSVGASTVIPLAAMQQPAAAGIFASQSSTLHNRIAQSDSGRVRAGTSVPVVQPNGKRIIVAPNETVPVTLVTQDSVRSSSGTVVIPRDTKIEGEFRPAQDGTQFVARRVIFRDGTERRLNARSNIVNNRREISRGVNTDPIWQGALVGGGASVLISSLVTKPGVFKTLAGAGAGALSGFLLGGRKKADVIVVEPDESLDLVLDSDLVLGSRY
jgi:hypothetical protein